MTSIQHKRLMFVMITSICITGLIFGITQLPIISAEEQRYADITIQMDTYRINSGDTISIFGVVDSVEEHPIDNNILLVIGESNDSVSNTFQKWGKFDRMTGEYAFVINADQTTLRDSGVYTAKVSFYTSVAATTFMYHTDYDLDPRFEEPPHLEPPELEDGDGSEWRPPGLGGPYGLTDSDHFELIFEKQKYEMKVEFLNKEIDNLFREWYASDDPVLRDVIAGEIASKHILVVTYEESISNMNSQINHNT